MNKESNFAQLSITVQTFQWWM